MQMLLNSSKLIPWPESVIRQKAEQQRLKVDHRTIWCWETSCHGWRRSSVNAVLPFEHVREPITALDFCRQEVFKAVKFCLGEWSIRHCLVNSQAPYWSLTIVRCWTFMRHDGWIVCMQPTNQHLWVQLRYAAEQQWLAVCLCSCSSYYLATSAPWECRATAVVHLELKYSAWTQSILSVACYWAAPQSCSSTCLRWTSSTAA